MVTLWLNVNIQDRYLIEPIMAFRIKTQEEKYLSGFLHPTETLEPRYRWTKSKKQSIRYGSYSEARTVMEGIQNQFSTKDKLISLEQE